MSKPQTELVSEKQSLRFIILALLTFIIYSFFQIDKRGFWYDELYSTLTSLSPNFATMYKDWLSSDGFPFGYQTLLFLWLKLVPASDFWIRMPHVLVSISCLLYIAIVIRSRFGSFVAALCIGFSMACYNFLYYAYTVRVYSFIFLFSWIAIIAVYQLALKDELKRPPLSFIALTLVLSYLHFFSLFFVFFLTSFLFFYRVVAKKKNFSEITFYLKFFIIHTILYIPSYFHLAYLLKLSYGKWQVTTINHFLESLLTNFAMPRLDIAISYYFILGGLLALTAAIARRSHPGESLLDRKSWYWIAFFFYNLICILLLSTAYSLNQDRYLIFFFPVVALTYSILLEQLISKTAYSLRIKTSTLIFMIFCSLSTLYAFNRTKKQDWKRSANFVLESLKDGDQVFVMGASQEKSSKEYLESGDVNGYFYVRTLDFYGYYFKQLSDQKVELKLYNAFPIDEGIQQVPKGKRTFILAPHHLRLSDSDRKNLSQDFQIKEEKMYSTMVYILEPV